LLTAVSQELFRAWLGRPLCSTAGWWVRHSAIAGCST